MIDEKFEPFPLKKFIRPEELFCNSLALLFPDNKYDEGRARKIATACRSANLDAKRLFVRDNKIILLCDCYVQIAQEDSVSQNLQADSYRFFMPGNAEIFAGEVPDGIKRKKQKITVIHLDNFKNKDFLLNIWVMIKNIN